MSAVPVADVKAYLNITGSVDAKLQTIIDAAEAKIAERVALGPTTITRQLSPNGSSLVLPVLPFLSLTSVTPLVGTALDVSLLSVDAGGVLTYTSSTSDRGVSFPASSYTVVYQAGHAGGILPPNLKLAVLELVRHLWAPQRGGRTRPGSQPSEATANTVPGAAFLMPFRVQELLNDFELPGFA